MQKLLNTYRDDPTLKNAQKIRAYERKHPMSRVLLPLDYDNLLADAIFHANNGG